MNLALQGRRLNNRSQWRHFGCSVPGAGQIPAALERITHTAQRCRDGSQAALAPGEIRPEGNRRGATAESPDHHRSRPTENRSAKGDWFEDHFCRSFRCNSRSCSQAARIFVRELPREAFGVRPACWRFRTVSGAPKREQAPRAPNASRNPRLCSSFVRAVTG